MTPQLGLKTALEEQKLKVWLAKLLGNVLPRLTFKSGLDIQQLSNDPDVPKAYSADPRVHIENRKVNQPMAHLAGG